MLNSKNEIIFDKEFIRDAKRLPKNILNKLSDILEVVSDDPFDSTLHTKPLSPPLQGFYSFRITRDYRVAFKFETSYTVRLLIVDKRDKIYKRLARKK